MFSSLQLWGTPPCIIHHFHDFSFWSKWWRYSFHDFAWVSVLTVSGVLDDFQSWFQWTRFSVTITTLQLALSVHPSVCSSLCISLRERNGNRKNRKRGIDRDRERWAQLIATFKTWSLVLIFILILAMIPVIIKYLLTTFFLFQISNELFSSKNTQHLYFYVSNDYYGGGEVKLTSVFKSCSKQNWPEP